VDVKDAMRAWSTGGYHMKHLDANIATVNAQLYAGEGPAAYETMRASWPRLVRSLLLQIQLVRVWSHWDRARCAIAAAQARPPARALLRVAARDARALEREGCGWSSALGKLVAAGIANVRAPGDPRSRALLERGIGDCDALGMGLHAASARCALGVLVGGDEGEALLRSGGQWMAAQSVRNPARMAETIVPGFSPSVCR
jgi:eukaryotic-like serine/threonine-protein kinase